MSATTKGADSYGRVRSASRAPRWARKMMRDYDVSGFALGHPLHMRPNGKLHCLNCGELADAPGCMRSR